MVKRSLWMWFFPTLGGFPTGEALVFPIRGRDFDPNAFALWKPGSCSLIP